MTTGSNLNFRAKQLLLPFETYHSIISYPPTGAGGGDAQQLER